MIIKGLIIHMIYYEGIKLPIPLLWSLFESIQALNLQTSFSLPLTVKSSSVLSRFFPPSYHE